MEEIESEARFELDGLFNSVFLEILVIEGEFGVEALFTKSTSTLIFAP